MYISHSWACGLVQPNSHDRYCVSGQDLLTLSTRLSYNYHVSAFEFNVQIHTLDAVYNIFASASEFTNFSVTDGVINIAQSS